MPRGRTTVNVHEKSSAPVVLGFEERSYPCLVGQAPTRRTVHYRVCCLRWKLDGKRAPQKWCAVTKDER
eukprot:6450317-Pyramimonas_sp.AAC.1